MTTERLTHCSWALVIALYIVRSWLSIDAEQVWRHYFLRESGLLDRAEAVLWLVALVLNARMLLATARVKRVSLATGWFLGMTLICLVLFGEEISWGQHVFGFSASETMTRINAQKETNFHNLNISLLLGIPKDSPIYPLFKNFNYILNPAYYLFACIVLIGIPLAKRRHWHPALEDLPTPNLGIVRFFAANVLAYAIVDRLIFDVGELFEFGIVTALTLAALDEYRQAKVAHASSPVHDSAQGAALKKAAA